MKIVLKILKLYLICLLFLVIIPKPAEAYGRNPDELAKLQKWVNSQIKKGAKLPKDAKKSTTNVQYSWDENGHLKEIYWSDCNLTGKIKLPSFSKLETVVISGNPGLKAIDAGKNPSLTTLRCAGCSPSDFETDKVKFAINKLSVRKCRNLKYLYAGWNNIKSIDVSNNKGLELLYLGGCKLQKLDISKNKKLAYLDISYNKKLPGINIKGCPAIEELNISGNSFTKIDISKNIFLKNFSFNETKFTRMDLRSSKKLEKIYCYNGKLEDNGLLLGENPNISLIMCYNNKLSKLDVSGCIGLVRLDCYNNKLLKLNIEKCVSLDTLDCRKNKITNLDLSANKELMYLDCSKNPLGKLGLGSLEKLVYLKCNNCKLSRLDLANTKELMELYCNNNKIKKLDISKVKKLGKLYCRNNKLSSLDLTGNAWMSELHCEKNKIKELDIRNCAIKDYLGFGSEFFSYDDGVVIKK